MLKGETMKIQKFILKMKLLRYRQTKRLDQLTKKVERLQKHEKLWKWLVSLHSNAIVTTGVANFFGTCAKNFGTINLAHCAKIIWHLASIVWSLILCSVQWKGGEQKCKYIGVH